MSGFCVVVGPLATWNRATLLVFLKIPRFTKIRLDFRHVSAEYGGFCAGIFFQVTWNPNRAQVQVRTGITGSGGGSGGSAGSVDGSASSGGGSAGSDGGSGGSAGSGGGSAGSGNGSGE